MKLAAILFLALSTLPAPARAEGDAGAPTGKATGLFQILNDPSSKRPDYWITYQLDLLTSESGDLLAGRYQGGRENGSFTIDEVKSADGAVLMRSQGVDALKLLGPSVSAKDGGEVTFWYITSPFTEPGQLLMRLARTSSGWSATEASTGKAIRQLKIKTRFCGALGACGVESVTVLE